MTFLEALYGSQYYEIAQKGRDGNKGRLNANLFLSAFIIIVFFAAFAMVMFFFKDLESNVNGFLSSVAGNSSGKSLGKLLAIPLLGIIYLIVSRTVGSKENFSVKVDAFLQCPDEEKEKATIRILIPFFIALGALLLFSLIG